MILAILLRAYPSQRRCIPVLHFVCEPKEALRTLRLVLFPDIGAQISEIGLLPSGLPSGPDVAGGPG